MRRDSGVAQLEHPEPVGAANPLTKEFYTTDRTQEFEIIWRPPVKGTCVMSIPGDRPTHVGGQLTQYPTPYSCPAYVSLRPPAVLETHLLGLIIHSTFQPRLDEASACLPKERMMSGLVVDWSEIITVIACDIVLGSP